MNHILKDYQERHRYERKKKRISVFEFLRIAVYAVVTVFLIHVVYKGFHRDEKNVEPTKKVLKTEARSSYV